ncbi:MAG: cytochrome P450 [Rhodobiaceae bacterium]|nr:cytochrome P450 [Rhodobiaceae bacterium]MCC0056637.1 cytochrome P450 [Rhodobiaceae bacterium]
MASKPDLNAPYPYARDKRCPLDLPPQIAETRNDDGMQQVTLWNGNKAWLATRWEDVRTILSSPDISSDAEKANYPAVSASRSAQAKSYKTIFTMDPPVHGQYRRTLTKDFAFKRMQELRPMIEEALNSLYDQMEQGGKPADFVEAVALPLPSLVVSMLLGVPYSDREALQEWSRNRMALDTSPEVVQDSAKKMGEYFDRLFAEKEALYSDKSKNPGDPADLVSRLAVEQILPGHITRLDAVLMCNILYIAGHETTANQIGFGLLGLLTKPEQKANMLQSDESVKNGVEEMLRYYSVVHLHSPRVCTKDMIVGGQEIKAGDGVFALLSGANRDPKHYDDPDAFDVTRNAIPHMAFGFGIHQCIGQSLARLELQILFESVFKRFPNLKLAVPEESLEYKENATVYGLKTLPVTW